MVLVLTNPYWRDQMCYTTTRAAIQRVLDTTEGEADALMRATLASKEAALALVNIVAARLDQMEERLQAMESRIKLFEEGGQLPEPGDLDPNWVDNFADRLYDDYVETKVFNSIDKMLAEGLQVTLVSK